MDTVTTAGLAIAIILIIATIMYGGPILPFVNIPSVLVVICGSATAIMVAYPGSRIKTLPKVLRNAFFTTPREPEQVMSLMQEMANRVRREGGLLALEEVSNGLDDEFLKRGVQMVVDGYDPQAIQEVLFLEIEKISDRHAQGADIFESLGAYAPAFGMIGTLIGLVQMLQNLDDPTVIGPSMAVALLTTFYGSCVANIFAIPVAKKLQIRSEEETSEKILMAHGLLSILAGENPRFMTERLNVQLPPSQRLQEAS